MILDASAFYAGVPFGSPSTYHTTPEVYGEIEHIKRAQRVADALQEMGRLVVISPQDDHVRRARAAALSSGDLPQLSVPDVSVLALASQTGLDIITDDYAVSNAGPHHMGIRAHAVMTSGPGPCAASGGTGARHAGRAGRRGTRAAYAARRCAAALC